MAGLVLVPSMHGRSVARAHKRHRQREEEREREKDSARKRGLEIHDMIGVGRLAKRLDGM